MNERRENAGLSTADMAAAVQQHDGQTATPERANGTPANGATHNQHAAPASEPRGAPASAAARANGAPAPDQSGAVALLGSEESQRFHDRWEEIQIGFVDEPRQAVEQADHLVAEVIKRVAELFAEERHGLEAQWNRGSEADTEALRMALKRYRSFFERLLSGQR